jgi:hypothetical protein
VLRSSGPSGWRVRAVASGEGSTRRKGSSQVDFVRAGFVFRPAEVLLVIYILSVLCMGLSVMKVHSPLPW